MELEIYIVALSPESAVSLMRQNCLPVSDKSGLSNVVSLCLPLSSIHAFAAEGGMVCGAEQYEISICST